MSQVEQPEGDIVMAGGAGRKRLDRGGHSKQVDPPGGVGPAWEDYRDVEEDVRSTMSYEGPSDKERCLQRELESIRRLLEQAVLREEPRRTLASARRPEVVLKVLQRWLPTHGYLTGRDITRYLRAFELGLRMARPTEHELIEAFEMTADLRVAGKVSQIRLASEDWDSFKCNVRDALWDSEPARRWREGARPL